LLLLLLLSLLLLLLLSLLLLMLLSLSLLLSLLLLLLLSSLLLLLLLLLLPLLLLLLLLWSALVAVGAGDVAIVVGAAVAAPVGHRPILLWFVFRRGAFTHPFAAYGMPMRYPERLLDFVLSHFTISSHLDYLFEGMKR
jgi:hypothetical protein